MPGWARRVSDVLGQLQPTKCVQNTKGADGGQESRVDEAIKGWSGKTRRAQPADRRPKGQSPDFSEAAPLLGHPLTRKEAFYWQPFPAAPKVKHTIGGGGENGGGGLAAIFPHQLGNVTPSGMPQTGVDGLFGAAP